jgi:hypothetical protein
MGADLLQSAGAGHGICPCGFARVLIKTPADPANGRMYPAFTVRCPRHRQRDESFIDHGKTFRDRVLDVRRNAARA